MKKSIFVIPIFALVVLGALAGQQLLQESGRPDPRAVHPAKPSNPRVSSPTSTSSSTTTPLVGPLEASPDIFPANTSVPVTLTVQITDPNLIANSVNLLRLGTAGSQPQLLGQMQGVGNGNYTIQVSFNESTVGQIQLQASAAFRGSLKRILSPVLPLLVLNIPTAFTLDSGPLSNDGPLSLNNFGNSYDAGGVIPQGGAAIDVTRIPKPNPPFSDFIAIELQDATNLSTAPITVSGVSCTRASYTDVYSATLTYSNVATYCPSGQFLYKFYLSHRSGDPNSSQYLTSYNQVLNSAILTP